MSYIRIKSIKKPSGNRYSYAYLVENKWKKRKKGARQKVKGFLGKVVMAEKKRDIDFFDFVEGGDHVEKSSWKRIITDLIRWELHRYDIKDAVDLNRNTVLLNGKNVVFPIGEGYLCTYTLRKLVNFRFEEDEHAGISLAKAFVEAGIDIPHEVFVKVFEKMNG